MRSYAIIPAAGLGRRLGGNKLLLPFRGTNILACLLQAWVGSHVSKVVVVVRKDDQTVGAIAEEAGVEVVRPHEDPCDMKASVQIGLRHVELAHDPMENDVWMLAPADMPRITADDINAVLMAHDAQEPAIIVPEINDQLGHPVLFPWPMRQQVFQLHENQGINGLVRRGPCRRIVLANPGCVEDIDTARDYRQSLR